MTRIEPALTRKQWESIPAEWEDDHEPLTGIAIAYTNGALPTGDLFNPFSPHALIALVNAALRDDDPSKIRREDVTFLRMAKDSIDPMYHNFFESLADRLESLLPPEPDESR